MTRGHVFIVNEATLPIHLDYMFVGTSSGTRDNNISLLADMFRVKKSDFIFFYIEGRDSQKGRFFGIFKAIDNTVYHEVGNNAKEPSLPVKLIYRKKIAPYKIYRLGILEWEVLDKLPTYSKEVLWSLIYRKMKGKRGNIMLLPWETERLITMIEAENDGNCINAKFCTFNNVTYEIIESESTRNYNMQYPISLCVNDIKISETHFQAYILQKIKIGDNDFLPEIFGKNIVWIGNEVLAGSGMQRIDIFTIEKIDDTSYLYRIIELKHKKSYNTISDAPTKLEYYIQWAREDIGGHVLGGRKFNIKPVLVLLTDTFNSIPKDTINKIKSLTELAAHPEIYEINFSLEEFNKVL